MATASLISGNVGNVIVDKGKVEHMYCLIENYPTSHHYLPSPASLNPPSFCPLHSSISTSHSILYPQIIIYSTALPCYISHKDTGIGSKFKLGGGVIGSKFKLGGESTSFQGHFCIREWHPQILYGHYVTVYSSSFSKFWGAHAPHAHIRFLRPGQRSSKIISQSFCL